MCFLKQVFQIKVLSSCVWYFTSSTILYMSFIASSTKKKDPVLLRYNSQTRKLQSSMTVSLIKTSMLERRRALPVKEGYISLSFIKEVCIGLPRLSFKPCRTWCGRLLACLGKRAEAIIVSPDAFLPGLRDVAWTGASSRVLRRVIQLTHHVWSEEFMFKVNITVYQKDSRHSDELWQDARRECRSINAVKHKADFKNFTRVEESDFWCWLHC